MMNVRIDGETPGELVEDDETSVSVEFDPDYACTCPDCGAFIPDPTNPGDGDHEPDCGSSEWEPSGPGTIANGAGVRVSDGPGGPEVSVWLSVGDPRGAFCMTLRRISDGSLILHLPHPGETMAHVETEELHPGTLRLKH